MNIFRLAGDMTHLASILVLLLKIHTIKSCADLKRWGQDDQGSPRSRAAAEWAVNQPLSVTTPTLLSDGHEWTGVSLKTQELYFMVFVTRYLDLFTHFISMYNTVMKLIFLGSAATIIWYMRRHKLVRRSYDKDQDTFPHLILVIVSLALALFVNYKLTFKEVLWTFSLYLEAVAILPQLVLLQKTRNIDNLTGQYVLLLGYLVIPSILDHSLLIL
ncbi:ER lumen protein-retaining receptor [Linum grandiflorum]